MFDQIDVVIQVVVTVGAILFSLTLHEAMHAFTSNWLGDDTARLAGRLTLNPLKHIDPINTVAIPVLLLLVGLPPFGAARPVPFNPYNLKYDEFGAAMVGAAGPLTNLVLAIFGGTWLRYVIGFDAGIMTEILLVFTVVNIAFFVFNMIPIPPLDGSRVLYALSPPRLQASLANFEKSGYGIFALFIIIFLVPGFGQAIGNIVSFFTEIILGFSVF